MQFLLLYQDGLPVGVFEDIAVSVIQVYKKCQLCCQFTYISEIIRLFVVSVFPRIFHGVKLCHELAAINDFLISPMVKKKVIKLTTIT